MEKLGSAAYDRVRPLFADITHSRACVYSVIERNGPGLIYVDDTDHPTTALLRFSGGEMYLAGDSDDDARNREIAKLMLGDLAPATPHLLVFSYSDHWKTVLDDVLAHRGVSRLTRNVFSLDPDRYRELNSDWRSRIPDGYAVQPMEPATAMEAEPGTVEMWGSVDAFFERAFGYLVVKDDELVSRISPVALGDRHVEVGAHTWEPYQRQGFATLAGCAYIERCLERDLLPDWGCYYNEASRRLALKLGFVQQPDVTVHYVRMSQAE